ncbi:MAG: HAD hydrolase family protein [Selenomonadaceae bacterium]|nr:HAD hydrolase family protein [Selenomonadaceae bacterium]
MKILFACDLDNTLIHSYKKFRAGDICVEIYDGREQSFISPEAFDLLKTIASKILFVPVTTRSIAQYRRIFWAEDFFPSWAVVANGAYLLDGDNQENFLREVVAPHEDELKTLQEKFSDNPAFNICRIVDESFLFLKCRDDLDADKISFDTNLTVQHTGKKIYLFPPKLNKGETLTLLTKKFSPDKIFCAGDSEIDLPMLELADVAFAPKNLCGKNFVCFETAEEFLKRIAEEFL